MEFYRGDIFYVRRGDTFATGSEMQSGRPGIIVSNDTANAHSPCVEVVYLTSQEKKPMPTHVTVKCKVLSTALCEGVYTVSKDRLGDFIRSASEDEMEQIDKALLVTLGLENMSDPESEDEEEEPEVDQSEIISLSTERDLYKQLYEQLLDKVVRV